MTDQMRQREVDYAIEAALSEQAGAERYRQYQNGARSGRVGVADGARPLEFDESGFPEPQHSPGFVHRVARLFSLY